MRRSARNADVDGAVLMVAPAARADRAAETRECCRRPASPLRCPQQQPPCAPSCVGPWRIVSLGADSGAGAASLGLFFEPGGRPRFFAGVGSGEVSMPPRTAPCFADLVKARRLSRMQFAQEVGHRPRSQGLAIPASTSAYLRGPFVGGGIILANRTRGSSRSTFVATLTVRDLPRDSWPALRRRPLGSSDLASRHDPLGISPAAVLKVRRVPRPPLHTLAGFAGLDAGLEVDELLAGRDPELIALLARMHRS